MNSKIAKGFVWKLLERFGVQGVQFILQVILARLLDPEHYGVLSLMLIFITLANVFIQNGFNTALIQNKDVTEEDYSSVFWVTLVISIILYCVVFAAAPFIGEFYRMPNIVWPLRAIALVLIPGAFNSVQLAKVSKEMDFRKVFFSNIGGILISGIVSIVLAFMGAGLWALVVQYLLNIVVACIVMFFTVKWVPRFIINWTRIKVLFSFGWKLLVSGLLDTLYQDLRSLVIGKKYDSSTLGYYNRGKQFPQFIVNAVNGTVQSVMLPAMSEKQENLQSVKVLTRHSIMISTYIMMPLMAGLAGVATSTVSLLLTDKWLPCVPYMRIYCFSLAFYPVHSCNLQAINAVGRSDIFLKLEIVKKMIGVGSLIIAVFCFDSPIAIAMTGMLTTLISCFINAFPNKRLINYSYIEQMRDILPSFSLSIVMFVIVLLIERLHFSYFAMLVIQVVTGGFFYIFFSFLFKLEPFRIIMEMTKRFIKTGFGKVRG